MTVTVESSLRPLSGWGRTTPTTALVSRPVDASSVLASLHDHPGGVIARGLGRSYGDAAQCSGGLTIDTAGLSHIGALDEAVGTIEVGGGVSLHDLMRRLIPAGWFVAVTPGTRYVTVGGAIAADVHGKNHHRDGSFARHVVEMTLVTPSGVITVAPDRDPELFWATAGGMGLTGVVVSAVLRLIPIETSWMQVDTQRFTRLEDLMSTMEETDFRYHYSVAWLDCVGGRNGDHRSVLTRGDHAPSGAIPDRLRGRSREVPGDPSASRAPVDASPAREPPVGARPERGVVPGLSGLTGFAPSPGRVLPPSRRGGWVEPPVWSRRGSCSTSSQCPPSGPMSSRTPSMRSRRRGCPPSSPC